VKFGSDLPLPRQLTARARYLVPAVQAACRCVNGAGGISSIASQEPPPSGTNGHKSNRHCQIAGDSATDDDV